jgi:3-isopropylmalate/(R)-2-methylmalate dehydratase small subunit
LDDPRFHGASILLSGANFGCGSSREHAPQAIRKAGFRAVVAEGYAEIFFGNATNIGLPCVSAARADLQRVGQAVAADPALPVTVDLAALQLLFGGEAIPLTMRDSARDALINGRWDAIGELLEGLPQVAAVADRLPYISAGA